PPSVIPAASEPPTSSRSVSRPTAPASPAGAATSANSTLTGRRSSLGSGGGVRPAAADEVRPAAADGVGPEAADEARSVVEAGRGWSWTPEAADAAHAAPDPADATGGVGCVVSGTGRAAVGDSRGARAGAYSRSSDGEI